MATEKGQGQEEIREEFLRWSARKLASRPFETRPSRPGRSSCPRVQDGWPANWRPDRFNSDLASWTLPVLTTRSNVTQGHSTACARDAAGVPTHRYLRPKQFTLASSETRLVRGRWKRRDVAS